MSLLRIFGKVPAPNDNSSCEIETADALTEGLERWKKVVDLDPENTEAVLSLCSVLRELGRNDDVDEQLSKLLIIKPDDRGVLTAMARQLLNTRRDEQALEAWKDLDKRWPNQLETLQSVGALLIRCDKAEESLEVVDRLEALESARAY